MMSGVWRWAPTLGLSERDIRAEEHEVPILMLLDANHRCACVVGVVMSFLWQMKNSPSPSCLAVNSQAFHPILWLFQVLNKVDKDGDSELNMSEFVDFIAISCVESQPIPKPCVFAGLPSSQCRERRFAKLSMSSRGLSKLR